ncbi:MAG: hypothetical protein P4M07_04780 [Xanthobacteraceae bacterium]|nr:hypothetical protein [Xanthobacteraceae bacterium]
MVAGIVLSPAAARSDCVAMAPGFDGVLRLDTGRTNAVPCAGPPRRLYAAVPSGRDVGPAPPAQAQPSKPAAPAAEAPPVPPAPAAPSRDDVARLRDQLTGETARLQDQLARLNAETAGLRAETRRLREQLARRDAGDADAVERRGADKQGTRIGPAPAEAVAPKGDMLKPPAAKDETRAAPGSAGDGKPTDQAELARRSSMAERAWSELLDLATRMKKDLSGKAE